MKFKIKSKAKISKVEEEIKIIEKKNIELSSDLNKTLYRMEEDTIRKLIKIEEEVKHKMNKTNVYDHVQYELSHSEEQNNIKLAQLTEKTDSECININNKLITMKLTNEKRDMKIQHLTKQLVMYDQKQKSMKDSIMNKVKETVDQRLEAYQKFPETEKALQSLLTRMKEAEEKISRVDSEIQEFFQNPMGATSKTPAAAGGEFTTTAKQLTDSSRLSVNQIEELKNRFKRLQYDNNRSITLMRQEIKDFTSIKDGGISLESLRVNMQVNKGRSTTTDGESSPVRRNRKMAEMSNQTSTTL